MVSPIPLKFRKKNSSCLYMHNKKNLNIAITNKRLTSKSNLFKGLPNLVQS
jgi:hypothetical protein